MPAQGVISPILNETMIATVPRKGQLLAPLAALYMGYKRMSLDLAALLQLLSQNSSMIFNLSVLSDEPRGP